MTKRALWLPVLAGLLAAIMAASIGVGAVPISPRRVAQVLATPGGGSMEAKVVWRLRLPRILLAAAAGAALGTAGAGYQGLFRNPLADPFVVGASNGAALGATVAIVAGWSSGWGGLTAASLAALVGAVLAVTAVFAFASVGRRAPALSLLLAGVALSSLAGAVTSMLIVINDEKMAAIFSWLSGSLASADWQQLGAALPLIAVSGGCLWALSRSLDALTFGEEAATSLGLRLGLLRGAVVVFASLATAAAVSAGGVIGFVGLIAPHLARMLVGPRHALAIPASSLCGALLLVLADDAARTVAAPSELPVGAVMALLGAPFFLYLLRSRQRELAGAA